MDATTRRLTLLLAASLLIVAGCCCRGICTKRASEERCPTDIRKTHFWCFGEDAIMRCPCGPKELDYGYERTCWREWPSYSEVWDAPALGPVPEELPVRVPLNAPERPASPDATMNPFTNRPVPVINGPVNSGVTPASAATGARTSSTATTRAGNALATERRYTPRAANLTTAPASSQSRDHWTTRHAGGAIPATSSLTQTQYAAPDTPDSVRPASATIITDEPAEAAGDANTLMSHLGLPGK